MGCGSALRGDVVAIDPGGCERYRRHYSANVFNIGLSKCGRYAAVQTANAPSDDGNLLEVLDLERCGQVFSVEPATGWADENSFEVDAEERLTALNVEHTRPYAGAAARTSSAASSAAPVPFSTWAGCATKCSTSSRSA